MNATAKYATVILVLLSVVAAGIYLSAVKSFYRSIDPHEESLEQLSQRLNLVAFSKGEGTVGVYYVAIGDTPPSYVLASGPPIYIFDAKGNFLDWIRDSGDEPNAMAQWAPFSCRKITRQQALEEIELCERAPER